MKRKTEAMCLENEVWVIISKSGGGLLPTIPTFVTIRYREGCILTRLAKFLKKIVMKKFIFNCRNQQVYTPALRVTQKSSARQAGRDTDQL